MIKYILQDKLVDANEAFVHVSDLALLRGYGIFDFFRLDKNKPLFIDDHIERFYNSALQMQLPVSLQKSELKALILEMLRHNKINNSGVRIVLTGGPSENGYTPGKPTLIVINEPMTPLPDEHFERGIKLISTSYKRLLPEIKTINYIKGIHMLPEIQQKKAVDVLFHYHRKILETTRSNFFLIDNDGMINTAGENILPGINRQHVLKIAEAHYDVEVGTVELEALNHAREAFITGTTKKITPVVQVDDIIIGDGNPGKSTKHLMKLYDQYLDDYLDTEKAAF